MHLNLHIPRVSRQTIPYAMQTRHVQKASKIGYRRDSYPIHNVLKRTAFPGGQLPQMKGVLQIPDFNLFGFNKINHPNLNELRYTRFSLPVRTETLSDVDEHFNQLLSGELFTYEARNLIQVPKDRSPISNNDGFLFLAKHQLNGKHHRYFVMTYGEDGYEEARRQVGCVYLMSLAGAFRNMVKTNGFLPKTADKEAALTRRLIRGIDFGMLLDAIETGNDDIVVESSLDLSPKEVQQRVCLDLFNPTKLVEKYMLFYLFGHDLDHDRPPNVIYPWESEVVQSEKFSRIDLEFMLPSERQLERFHPYILPNWTSDQSIPYTLNYRRKQSLEQTPDQYFDRLMSTTRNPILQLLKFIYNFDFNYIGDLRVSRNSLEHLVKNEEQIDAFMYHFNMVQREELLTNEMPHHHLFRVIKQVLEDGHGDKVTLKHIVTGCFPVEDDRLLLTEYY